jgi:hypothetical protein
LPLPGGDVTLTNIEPILRDAMSETNAQHAAYDSKIEGNIIFTKVDTAINYA